MISLMSQQDHSPGGSDSPRPRRRQRYAGTHPRHFSEKYKELDPTAYPGFHDHVRSRGATPAGTHVPILVAEVMEALHPATGEVVADCTLGFGGHAEEFLKRIGHSGRLVGFDVDERQLERTRRRLAEAVPDGRISLHRANFAGVGNVLGSEGLDGYDVIFADLGVSSMQIDDPARGFTYKHEGPLDMRMDERLKRTATDLLATLTVEELSAALDQLADEPDHERIAKRIAQRREQQPIRRTSQLTQLIFDVKGLSRRHWREQVAGENELPGSEGGRTPSSERLLHPAARTFQALRIMVNDELGSLRQLLRSAPYCLRPGGRLGILAFHSGEDRLVKQAFHEGLESGVYAEVSVEPVRPSSAERYANPRSIPAKLRWARRATS